jgi:hypothetical protein
MFSDDTVVFFNETQPSGLSFQAFSVSNNSNAHQPKEMPVLEVAVNDKPVLTPVAGGRPPLERRYAKEFNEGNLSGILYEGKQGRLQLEQEQR